MTRNMDQTVATRMASQLAAKEYDRQRWQPQPGDAHHLVLSDLRLALETFKTNQPFRLLDYGCGSSPYRGLFPAAQYQRADYLDTGNLDYRIEPGHPLKASPRSFDLILSTQVLEHVEDVAAYLRDCHRILAPTGQLVLTTHGTFPDHGCPYDFQRWTADGLKRDLRNAGFQVVEARKITVGPRAVLFLLEQYAEEIVAPKGTTFGFTFGLVRRLLRSHRKRFHEWVDRHFCAFRVVDAAAVGHSFYVGLLAVARPVPH